MRKRPPPPEPASRWKLPALLAASLVAVAATGAFTYARFENAAARRRVEAACRTLRTAEDERANAFVSASRLAPDSPDKAKLVAIDKVTRQSRVCEPLQSELTGYRWNFGRRWRAPPIEPGALPSREEIAALGARARPRCVAQVGMFLELLRGQGGGPSDEKQRALLDLCDVEKQSARALETPESARPLRLLDEWPAELERMAAAVAPVPHPASSSLE